MLSGSNRWKKLPIIPTIIPICSRNQFLFGILIIQLPLPTDSGPFPWYTTITLHTLTQIMDLIRDTELYNQDLLEFQYVLDDIEHYNKTAHENPPITHNKKTRALIENWQMNDGTNHPVFRNPSGTENTETCITTHMPQNGIYHQV